MNENRHQLVRTKSATGALGDISGFCVGPIVLAILTMSATDAIPFPQAVFGDIFMS